MAQIICENVSVSYEKEKVIDNVSFSIEAGDYVSIVGENGSGKSSIIKAVLGLVPLRGGKVTLAEDCKRTHIGYISQQNPSHEDFPASVSEVVLSGCLSSKGFWPFYSKRLKKTAREYMELLGVDEFADKTFRDLSGGQKQRAMLARALCATDKVLFLDEPVTGLDPVAILEFYEIINNLNKKMGITIIMITHDIQNALNYSNKILHLYRDSSKYFFGTKEDYMKHEGYHMCSCGSEHTNKERIHKAK